MRAEILKALRANKYQQLRGYLSGEQLSRQLGVSRTTVWKYIQELRRRYGYKIKGSTKLGYKLLGAADRLLEFELASLLTTKILGSKIYYYDLLDTTMDKAHELARAGIGEGAIIIAEGQRKGRGRRGRSWQSIHGKGIWQSIILRPNCMPQEVGAITLAAAVACAEAIYKVTGLSGVATKWPNDVLISGKKVAGILTEMVAEADVVNYVNLGVGINVNQTYKDFAALNNATSIRLSANKKISRSAIEVEFLNAFEELYLSFKAGDKSKILSSWRQLDVCLKAGYIVLESQGKSYKCRAVDIDDNGNLIVVLDKSKTMVVYAGDVSFIGSA